MYEHAWYVPMDPYRRPPLFGALLPAAHAAVDDE
jgi:hypothetical protein